MAKANLLDNRTVEVTAQDGEVFTLQLFTPLNEEDKKEYLYLLAESFDRHFCDDKSYMIYKVFNDATYSFGNSFTYLFSDRSEERKRIGKRIKELREQMNVEAKDLAALTNIDPANLCRIEQGKYSVGFDILSKIATVLGAKVELTK